MATDPSIPAPGRRRRWPWFLVVALLLAAAGAAALLVSQGVWTDGGDLRVPVLGAHVREIVWDEPVSPGPQFDLPDQVYEPAVSPDGQELYFVRGMPITLQAPERDAERRDHSHIYVSYRKDNDWSKPVRLSAIDPPRGSSDDLGPRLSADGKYLYFSSNRPGGFGGYDIWVSTREKGSWSSPANLGPSVNTAYNEYDPDPTPDGKHLIFTTNRTAAAAAENEVWHGTIRDSAAGDYDLWIADTISAPSEQSLGLQFSNSRAIDGLNTSSVEGASCMSPSGDFLYFTSNRPGGFGKFDLYRSRYADGSFGPPEDLGASINSADNDTDPAVAADGYRIYFSSDRPTASDRGPGKYHLLSAESREVFPAEQGRPLPHFGWSIWGVLGCGVAAVLLILLLRGTENRRLNLLQRCLVVSVLVHVLFTFSLSFVALTQQVTHYVTHDTSTPVRFSMPKDLAEKIAVRTQIEVTPVPPAPPRNIAPSVQVQVPSEALSAPPPSMQVTIPDALPRPNAVQIAVAAPQVQPIAPAPAPVAMIVPALPPLAPAPLPDMPTLPPLPKPVQANEAQPNITPPALAAQQQIPHPADASASPSIDLGQPNLPRASPPPIAALPQVIEHAPEPAAPAVPDPGAPAPPPALPAPQVDLNPAIARVPAKQQKSVDDIASAADAVAINQSPRGDADSQLAHSAGPANVPLDAPPIKKSIVTNSPATVAMAEHNAGRPDLSGASALPGVAATQPAQVADVPPADLPSGLHSDAAPAPATTEPAIASSVDTSDLAHLGPIALAAPAASLAEGSLVAAATPPQSPSAAATASLAGDPALGWKHGDPSPMGAVQSAPPAPAPAVTTAVALTPDITLTPMAANKPAPPANPTPDASAAVGPVAIASARISADVPPAPSPAIPDIADTAHVPDAPGPVQSAAQATPGSAMVSMAPISRPDVSAPAVVPQVNLQPLTGLSGPSSPFARSSADRSVLLQKNGGTAQSEDSVDRGLAYLASTQQSDGRWTRIADDGPPGGRPVQTHDMACTGLSLLAFLAHDQTPDKPCQYRDAVAKTADYLLSQQGPDGDMRGPDAMRGGGADRANMYDHGISSFALGELALMTHDPRYTQAALKAAAFTVSAQNADTGGWRYMPGEPGDSSVFGWQVMSLHTAEELGFAIPQKTRDGAKKFIGLVGQGEFKMLASYQGNAAPTPPMTAEILFCRMWLGQKLTTPEIIEATGFLAQQRPNAGNPDLYYWYYASLCMLQMHTDQWKDWNNQTRDTLIAMQQKAGYWDINVRWGDRGGRAFTTAIATLTLEVYYRYLPLQTPPKPR